MILQSVSQTLLDALIAETVFAIVFPPLLGWFVSRKLHVSWRWFFYGMFIFLLAASVEALPIAALRYSFNFDFGGGRWLSLGALALIAGVFEESGRLLGFVYLFGDEPRTWNRAVMYGLGQGAFESMFDKAVLALWTLSGLLLVPQLQDLQAQGIPTLELQTLMSMWAKVAAMSAWLPLFGAAAIAADFAIHACLSVMVLQVFQRRRLWILAAIALHTAIDFSIFATASIRPWAGPLVAISWSFVCLYFLFRLCQPIRDDPARETAEAVVA